MNDYITFILYNIILNILNYVLVYFFFQIVYLGVPNCIRCIKRKLLDLKLDEFEFVFFIYFKLLIGIYCLS